MNIVRSFSVGLVLSCCAAVSAQQEKVVKVATTVTKPTKMPYYIDAMVLNVGTLLLPAPAVGSAANEAELAELHRIEQTRTPDQIAQAKADEAEEDMFAFAPVFGPGFTPAALPLTAALGAHVKNEQSVVGGQL